MVDERDEEGGKEDLFEKEDKFDAFTPEGEALGYITLEQARLVAMQTARDDPGNYGSRFSGVRMVYEVDEQDEGEDYYTITMTFRPEGDFRGTPGREQFVIEKEGRVASRQVPSLPSGGRKFPILPVAIALVAVVAGDRRWKLVERSVRRTLPDDVTLADDRISHVSGRSGGVRRRLHGGGRVAERLTTLATEPLIGVWCVLGLTVRTNGHGDFTPEGGSCVILHRARGP